MRRRGTATALGAATVLNAVANWKGSAFGVDLKTSAEVVLDESPAVKGDVPGIDDRLIVRSVERVLERFGVVAGGVVRTWSDIPLARGLKSSSAAANAAVLATLDALGEDLDPLEATRIGVAAARDAGVTITGEASRPGGGPDLRPRPGGGLSQGDDPQRPRLLQRPPPPLRPDIRCPRLRREICQPIGDGPRLRRPRRGRKYRRCRGGLAPSGRKGDKDGG